MQMMRSVLMNNQLNLANFKTILEKKGFTITKHKKKESQQGLGTINFRLFKGSIEIDIFVMKLSENNYICAGYSLGKLIQEKSFKNPAQLSSVIEQIFAQTKPSKFEYSQNLGDQLQRIRVLAQQKANKISYYHDFAQQMKTSNEYIQLLQMKINLCEKIDKDAQNINRDNKTIQQKYPKFEYLAKKLNQQKNSLYRAITQYKQLHLDTKKIKARLEECINQERKEKIEQLTLYNIIDFSEQLQALSYLKQCQLIMNNLEEI